MQTFAFVMQALAIGEIDAFMRFVAHIAVKIKPIPA